MTAKIAVYEVGARLEVGDFSDDRLWYPAKIVEVDTAEREILVHFENWSSRFDEWIKMDSNRLRPSSKTSVVRTQFVVGEKVEALWSIDGQRYPGVIQTILPNDYYQVVFDDGIKLKKKYNQIFKLKKITRGRPSGSWPAEIPQGKSRTVRPLPSLVPAPTLSLQLAGKLSANSESTSLTPPNPTQLPRLTRNRRLSSKPSGIISPPDLVKGMPSPVSLTEQSAKALRPISPETVEPLGLSSSQQDVIASPKSPAEELNTSEEGTPVEARRGGHGRGRGRGRGRSTLTSSRDSETAPDGTGLEHYSIFTPTTAELGKRKRTVSDYTVLLKTQKRLRQPRSTSAANSEFEEGSTAPSSPATQTPLSETTETSAAETPQTHPQNQLQRGSARRRRRGNCWTRRKVIPSNAGYIPMEETGSEVDMMQEAGASAEVNFTENDNDVTRNSEKHSTAKVKVGETPSVNVSTETATEVTTSGDSILPKRRRTVKNYSALLNPKFEDDLISSRLRTKRSRTQADPVDLETFQDSNAKATDSEDGLLTDADLVRNLEKEYCEDKLKQNEDASFSVGTVKNEDAVDSDGPSSDSDFKSSKPASSSKKLSKSIILGKKSLEVQVTSKPVLHSDAQKSSKNGSSTKRRASERYYSRDERYRRRSDDERQGTNTAGSNRSPSREDHANKSRRKYYNVSTDDEGSTSERELEKPGASLKSKHEEPKTVIRKRSQSGTQQYAQGGSRTDEKTSDSNSSVKEVGATEVFKRRSRMTSYKTLGVTLESLTKTQLSRLSTEVSPLSLSVICLEGGRKEGHKALTISKDSPLRISNDGPNKIPPRDTITTRRKSRISIDQASCPPKLEPMTIESDPEEELLDPDSYHPAPKTSKPAVPTLAISKIPSVVLPKIQAAPKQRAQTFHHSSTPPTGIGLESIGAELKETPSSSHTAASHRGKSRKRKTSVSRQWLMRKKRIAMRAMAEQGHVPIIREKPRVRVPRPGDVLSGMTAGRLAKIRRKLTENGRVNRLAGEAIWKDVSVDIISCSCGITDEFGLMVQCELCQCWQHGNCFGIEDADRMPAFYVCESCRYPDLQKDSKRDDWDHEFNKTGTLPRFSFSPALDSNAKRIITEGNEMLDRLYMVRDLIHSTQSKINICEAVPDHPKIYQWHKPHPSPKEENQARNFNKIYRPVLKRLLRAHGKDLENYKTKLREKIAKRLKMREDKKFAAEKFDLDDSQSSQRDSETEHVVKEEVNDQIVKAVLSDILNEIDTSSSNVTPQSEEKLSEASSGVQQLSNVESDKAKDTTLPLTADIKSKIVVPTTDNLLDMNLDLSDADGKFASMDVDLDATCNLNPFRLLEAIGGFSATTDADPETNDLLLDIFDDPDFGSGSIGLTPDVVAKTEKPTDQPSTSYAGPAPPVRITPELCRVNLIKSITDQQSLVDEHLDEMEKKVLELETLHAEAKLERERHPSTSSIKSTSDNSTQHNKLAKLQRSLKLILNNIQVLRRMPNVEEIEAESSLV